MNLNTAVATDLQSVDGISLTVAQRTIDNRPPNGYRDWAHMRSIQRRTPLYNVVHRFCDCTLLERAGWTVGQQHHAAAGAEAAPTLCTALDLSAASSSSSGSDALMRLPLKTLVGEILDRYVYWSSAWTDVRRCDICLQALPHKYCAPSSDGCDHTDHICTSCMREYAMNQIQNGGVQEQGIRCPYHPKASKNCGSSVPDASLSALLTAEEMQRYSRFKRDAVISADPSRRWCPHAPCDAFIDITVSTTCAKCKKQICADCGGGAHPGRCEDAADKKLSELVEKMGWKRCPFCKKVVERTEGCNEMRCHHLGCGKTFCYGCATSPCSC